MVNPNPQFWKSKKVLVTGHTGFKGSWLCLWLKKMGANIAGVSLEPTSPSAFNALKISEAVQSTIADIKNFEALKKEWQRFAPEIVFHLAAQSLVSESYKTPVETYQTNVIGTLNVLECARLTRTGRAIVNVTTDKCYENTESNIPLKESDPLGGRDPYSSSKACSEILSSAYRRSFLAQENIHLASARAGNVIGGGDWNEGRLIPDAVRAARNKGTLTLRNPGGIRPWQFVLEPLSGYLLLAEKLWHQGQGYAESWNFGPERGGEKSVEWIINSISPGIGLSSWSPAKEKPFHEHHVLRLDNSKAKERLHWRPRLDLEKALNWTAEWYAHEREVKDLEQLSLNQINEYESLGN